MVVNEILRWHWASFTCFMFVVAGCDNVQDKALVGSKVSSGVDLSEVLQLVTPSSVVDASPAELHSVQVTLRNSGKNDLKGVTPKLPCSCHIVDPLPSVFAAGTTQSITFKALTPFAGKQVREVEFFDGEMHRVGIARLEFRVSGQVPRLAHPFKPIQILQVAREIGKRYITFETIEEIGRAQFILAVVPLDDSILQVRAPHLEETHSPDKKFVMREYRFPVEVEADSPGNVRTEVQLQFSNGTPVLTLPVSVNVLPGAVLVPRELVIKSAELNAGRKEGVTFRLIPRVPGETYDVIEYDSNLVKVDRVSNSERQQWTVSLIRPEATTKNSVISLLSSKGDRVELPVTFIW